MSKAFLISTAAQTALPVQSKQQQQVVTEMTGKGRIAAATYQIHLPYTVDSYTSQWARGCP